MVLTDPVSQNSNQAEEGYTMSVPCCLGLSWGHECMGMTQNLGPGVMLGIWFETTQRLGSLV